MNDIYSFYQLISKYQIEIPIIQRDYAQGRENAKAADVRKSLVSKMIDAVKNSEPLFFDFVYGRVDNNKFIPFDGQQRLTTLFLFHKYVFEKCQSDSGCNHKDNCSCRDILGRFSYATRQSSREFCEKLVQVNVIPSDDKKVSEDIKNQSWFYPDWQKDPTVIGMLTMLDEIHIQMKNVQDFKHIAEKLTSGCICPITFHFVDMGEHKLSDETYVKMNARGKQLTPFENFKASLEQYLIKAKNRDLLSRLEGKYDISQGKYTGIDGTWLDLFWNVANEGKTEKELPDTLMMSFFNRHFMNVWRCWYANNSKSRTNKDVDRFNTRIQKEMPLYPTKDDFVSFEIYQGIIEKCGIDECLTPLFNICDALFEKGDSIKKDCQAVWNRDKGTSQWDLYYGDKNNNRETYPSRVAFYALMKYFSTQKDTKKLSQWMRVVWNIIENSTIDSSEPYHAALRLIEKLSAKCTTIYYALANDFDSFRLDGQYHAKEQVAEEIAKAKQILDEDGNLRKYKGSCKKEDCSNYETWEDIIIDAEKTAFFKGTIRFLFQNENGDINISTGIWNTENFDTKFNNSKKYFDENGIKDIYKVEVVKSLVFLCDDWENQLYDKQIFDPQNSTWKWILTDKNWTAPIHNILTKDLNEINCSSTLNNPDANKYILPILKNLPYKEFIIEEPRGRFRWNGQLGYYKPNGRDAITFDWGNFRRNELLTQLKLTRMIKISNKEIGSFWWGWNIGFIYKNLYFKFYWNNTICLMNDNWNGKKLRVESEQDKPENNFYYQVSEKETSQSLLEQLDNLIQAFNNKSNNQTNVNPTN